MCGDNCNNWAINAITRALGRMYFENDVNILSPQKRCTPEAYLGKENASQFLGTNFELRKPTPKGCRMIQSKTSFKNLCGLLLPIHPMALRK